MKKPFKMSSKNEDLSRFKIVETRMLNLYLLDFPAKIGGFTNNVVVGSKDWLIEHGLDGRLLISNVGMVHILNDDEYSIAVYFNPGIAKDILEMWEVT